MNFLNKLERKIGRYAIPNLTLVLIIGFIIGYVLEFLAPNILAMITLNPSLIMKGQIWRLVTWVICPPTGLSIFTIIVLMFYYSLGTTLEHTLGTFRYNLYIFGGILFTDLGVIGLYLFGLLYLRTEYFNYTYASTYYLCMSIFFAIAAEYPNQQVLIWGLIPVKMKVLAWIDGAFMLVSFVTASVGGKVLIVASILNFIIFYLCTRNYKKISPKEIKRKSNYKKKVKEANRRVLDYGNGARHKCAICGRTELDDAHLEFRYCSKCKGSFEYCQEHLFTHEHKK